MYFLAKKNQNVCNIDQKKCQKEQFDYFGKLRLKCQKNIGKMMLAMTREEINYFTGDINEQTNFRKI